MRFFNSVTNNLRIILSIFTIIVLFQQIAVVAVSGIFTFHHQFIYGIVTICFVIFFTFTIFFFVAVIYQYTTSSFVWISSILAAGSFHFYALFGIVIYFCNVDLIYLVIPQHFIQHIVRTPYGCTTQCKFEKDMNVYAPRKFIVILLSLLIILNTCINSTNRLGEQNQTTATLIFILLNYFSGIIYLLFSTLSYHYYVKALKNEEHLKTYQPI